MKRRVSLRLRSPALGFFMRPSGPIVAASNPHRCCPVNAPSKTGKTSGLSLRAVSPRRTRLGEGGPPWPSLR